MSELSIKNKAIIPIAAFTALGDRIQIKDAIIHSLDDATLTINEIKEIILQLYAYTGFPRAINAMNILMITVNERKQHNINDNFGQEAIVLTENENSFTLGTAIQTKLAGKVVEGPLFDFAPALNQFLRSHLFGDIFGRSLLNHQEREIATIAALSTYRGIDEQLKAHFQIALNTKLTKIQLREITDILGFTVDKKIGIHALNILEQ